MQQVKLITNATGAAAYLLGGLGSDDKVGARAGDIVPAIQPRQRDLPVDEVGVVENVAVDVVVPELLGRQHDGHLGVVQLRQDLHKEVRVADHVGIKHHHDLQWLFVRA